MDFRYKVNNPNDGEFWLDHCGALLDVEPMGDDYVVGMCHAIEDPTFDATASATNPKAQMRPIHRPPRHPSDRHPHCHWTVKINESYPDVEPIPLVAATSATLAASLELAPIDPADDGAADYSGPLLSDVDFGAFSKSALVRIADEVCVQQHLLNLAFTLSVRGRIARTSPRVVTSESSGHVQVTTRTADDHSMGGRIGEDERCRQIGTKQLTGIAAIAAERLARALRLDPTPEGAVRALAVHPVFNPAGYVEASFDGRTVAVTRSAAHEDGAWLDLCGPHSTAPLQAMVRAIDPRYDVEIAGTRHDWQATVIVREEPAPEAPEVQIARFSGGTTFAFKPRASLPLTTTVGRGN